MDVLVIVLAMLGGIIGGLIGKGITRVLRRRREEQHLRYVRVMFPNAKTVEAISVSGTDKQAIENVERRLRDASRNL